MKIADSGCCCCCKSIEARCCRNSYAVEGPAVPEPSDVDPFGSVDSLEPEPEAPGGGGIAVKLTSDDALLFVFVGVIVAPGGGGILPSPTLFVVGGGTH